jgi:hypothetical protein
LHNLVFEPNRNENILNLGFGLYFRMEAFLLAIDWKDTEVLLQVDDDGEVVVEVRAGGWVWTVHIPDPFHYNPPMEMDERLMVACTTFLTTIVELFELD